MTRVLVQLRFILADGVWRGRRREGGAALSDVMDLSAERAGRVVATDQRRPVVSGRRTLGREVVEKAVETEGGGRGGALVVGEVGQDVRDSGVVAPLRRVEDRSEVVVTLALAVLGEGPAL